MPKENEITSADELNKQGRQIDVLVSVLDKCEKLEAKNKRLKEELIIARDILICFVDFAKKYGFTNIEPIEEKIQELVNIIID
jgi:hypothetical protein